MANILPNIKHVVVVMLENRSFDTILGWLYPDGTAPGVMLPAGSSPHFDGVHADMSNPSKSGERIHVTREVSSFTMPSPAPQDRFANVNVQLGLTDGGSAPSMQGFVLNYQAVSDADPSQVMQCHSPAQLPVLSTLARAYAVCDAWFSSVPTDTLPNRAFALAGTSNARVNDGMFDPFQWTMPTIFNVLSSIDASWNVYIDSQRLPSVTRTTLPRLWDPLLSHHFKRLPEFSADCANGTLPQYSFIEPNFFSGATDQHPPHDMRAGEKLLYDVWTAVSTSPAWNETLMIVLYDEHGGCFDHVPPPSGALAPDARSAQGDPDTGFTFDRFGIRVPAVVISPYIAAGTVFRSPTDTPYDHTSILSTLRDWLDIPAHKMLPSARIAQAPTLEHVLTLKTPRDDLPQIAAPATNFAPPPPDHPLHDLQKLFVSALEHRFGLNRAAAAPAPSSPDAASASPPMTTLQHALDFFTKHLPHLEP
ncbi:alkaline phosphatase family protein [Paraburkholderia solisilvae]|uniref:Phospholipase C 3 n=1 Tax=Paraburkholderia solisilvae TaxID=624376 RepID=A0A6J5E1M1_9BURK|nr:alkaline phosphatase family protein [Paraburkholderia solisilvae]CAB3760360.1 Phospholipase C 3 [Paraburkholderia solisilvae]